MGEKRRCVGGGRWDRAGRSGRVACSAERMEPLVGIAGYAVPERMKVASLVALVMCLCNADRVVMSVAVVPLAAHNGWSSSFVGIVQSSFMWGYLVSSVLGGALADRYGGKRVMAVGAALWSLATFLTPWAAARSTAALLIVRAIFGLAEGVAIPCMNVILSRWFPIHERATAVGLSMAGFHLGNVLSLLVSPVLMSRTGIQGPFLLFSAVGFLWLSVWAVCMVDDPATADHTSDGGGGGDLLPLRHLLSKMPSWAIIFANITNNWGYFVLLTWMPVYFKTVFGADLKEAAWFSAVPWGLMALSGYLAGFTSDFLIRSGHPVTFVRKLMQSLGFIGPGVSLLFLNLARTPAEAAVLLSVALGLSAFSQAGFLLNMQDIAPKQAGFLHGIANSIGTFAAIISTVGTGYFVQWLGSFQAFLTITSVLYFITAIFWNVFATAEQVFF
ncbi:unnamed protein product [Spirodela intermedia]|uniref:Major facilitator superfamily (MFS) profile domain-containing protein n=1 Tax=Spirodela intermedia TaxID=51605 RepID=A0A7I8IGB7_SPIIN|nr:unnamed protein product [Spirodela intermedia]CAA6656753.1 unnamed protein product [Spirodela intermedia]